MGHFGEHKGVATVVIISSVAVLSCALLYWKQKHQRTELFRHRPAALGDEKPQKNFRCVLADNSLAPFIHLPTEESENVVSHPYGGRIRSLLEHPPSKFGFMEPGYGKPPGMEGPFEWIGTRDQLEALVRVLSEETQFAVDTEQHSFHSFHGFTALVQISTRKTDYLVDSIALHDCMSILGPVFANPAICKVFHGADSDVLWLQRDFHIYVVNMFDTAKACLVLGKSQRSLAYLLRVHCDVVTDKVFQLADWRLRPLPEDMVHYARTDAHYLLYIAHQLCDELALKCLDDQRQALDANVEGMYSGLLFQRAVNRSNLTCLQLYEKDGVSASHITTAKSLLSRFYNIHGFPPPSQVDDKFVNLVADLCEWRDSVARTEDESLRAVLSDAALIFLASSGPSTPDLVYSAIAAADGLSRKSEGAIPPFASPSPFVESHIHDLCSVIQRKYGLGEDLLQNGVHHLKARSDTFFHGLVEKALSLFKVSRAIEKEEEYKVEDGPMVAGKHTVPKRWRQGNIEKSRIQFVKKFACKAPVYHNCRIYADDGRLLCYCDRKKLEWYVNRELAEFVQEEPPAVRLLFQPKGRPEDEGNDFYIQSKSNRCVGCGESSHYLRYRIIPSCYRQHFPEHLKSHRSHDIVLLCVDCHEVAHKAAEKHKHLVAVEYGVPLFTKVTGSETVVGGQKEAVVSNEAEGVSPLQLKTAAVALLRYGKTIPIKRRGELEQVVQTFYGRDKISDQDLHAILALSKRPHGRRRLSNKVLSQGEGPKDREVEVHCDTGSASTPAGSSTTFAGDKQGESCTLAESEEKTGRYCSVDIMQLADGQNGVSFEVGKVKNVSSEISFEGKNQDDDVENQTLRIFSGRHRSRKNESLLGHGVHGRRVVEILMKEEGDEGIRIFTQRWRRVFVEALQPTFLPLGWDVSHSGRREFGDFSVYKPLEGAQ